jgi:hypothetical protein
VLRIARGIQPATDFQKSFARAGHAHAGLFAIFALIAQILATRYGRKRRSRKPLGYAMARGRIELPTPRFSVVCSTN